ncbi:peptide chain release factor PrfB2, chloroplastic-like isoform X2 [Lolium rigidum]|uniref:peptide chain release factor PrfB2, chloroplastic-like isoform X2 n=1 Tax=Lolium rigidum TaxID=89674 RepID=UPI001F5C5320|nr:peptide chain release factor PrfB2, chloroplastic-like isoform X2 [Lolium rigidum]
MGKIKSVNQFEQELKEHIDTLRHAHGEGDNELEMQISSLFYPLVNCPVQEYMKALADMRRDIKEKELNALFSGDRDPYPCFTEPEKGNEELGSLYDWKFVFLLYY